MEIAFYLALAGIAALAALALVQHRSGRAEAEARIRAEAELAAARAALETMRAERDGARVEREAAETKRIEAERDAALARQEVTAAEKRMADWDATRGEMLQGAKAAVSATAADLSNKLLADHKRESEAARTERETAIKRASEDFLKQVQALAGSVSALGERVTRNDAAVATVHRALSTPGEAGSMGETVLANTLKAMGLAEGRDYVVQATLAGEDGRRKPDALVFLPGDALLVIDMKASKHLLEMATAEGEAAVLAARKRLAERMNQNLADLKTRDYRGAVLAEHRRAGRSGEVAQVFTVMALPNEGAVERLREADPEFMRKAVEARIVPLGPAGLTGVLVMAQALVERGRQAENQKAIVEAASRLLGNLAVVTEHAERAGEALRKAATAFKGFSASFNRSLLPPARHMIKLGVRPDKGRELPVALPSFEVHEHETGIIDVDVEEVTPPPALPDGRA
ncbi:MAG: DNA recombination protein RmuC [Alphaproteobacteria bacterium]|nr:DNA recombination protein RmuC [Alphaproteobacteria bacterium]